ncbi:uncharacterized protein LOC134881960 isoform X2 [Eleginops maclovinus]|uniref:uncharacterized protein LOC134881960 isoform X2 n=1 Tax=Eleginops maclovinus TaxID=56733 RepID=UPI0030805CEB
MPSFDLLHKVEQFVKHGTFSEDASKTSKKVTKAASKKFIYKDGCLWRSYRGRLLRVVKSDQEVRELMVRFHDNNHHAGRVKVIKEIMLRYYWVGVTKVVKSWIKECAVCQNRSVPEPHEPPVQVCLAYGCDATSYIYPELSFHRFPKVEEQRRRWLAVAQRDEGSLRTKSCLCSKHFEPSCFTLSDEGQMTLSPDAVPTIIPVTAQEDQVPVASDEDFLYSSSVEDLFSAARGRTRSPTDQTSERPAELQEHQYCLPGPDTRDIQKVMEVKRRKTLIEPSFKLFNQIARYLSHRVLPMQNKKSRGSLKRMSKRFGLKDGVLMYTQVSPPVRVLRSRAEVNSILHQFHDDQNHCGLGVCQREITKRFYWDSMTRELARWVSSCQTCINRTKRRWLRCSVQTCPNGCGPVERGLGLTFHKFPLDNTALLRQWLKAVGRPHWHPRLGSSVCSSHFTEDCFDRSGEKVTVRPDAVPTLMVHGGEQETPIRGPIQPGVDEAYFAKYDAVELYLSKQTYPPGLSYVEKNTFRRFCKKYCIKGGRLHIEKGGRLCLILRSRQRVEEALVEFHDELNHLNANKCLRLLNERYFWKTMRPDVVQWINSCSECSRKTKKKKPEIQTQSHTAESPLQTLRSPQNPEDLDRGRDAHDHSDDGENGVVELDEDVGDEESWTTPILEENPVPPPSLTPARIPILVHLKTPITFQLSTPIILQPRTSNDPILGRLFQKQTNPSNSVDPVHLNPQIEEQAGPHDQKESVSQARTLHFVKVQNIINSLPESHSAPEITAKHKAPQTRTEAITPPGQSRGLNTQTKSPGSTQQTRKRRRDLDGTSPAKKISSSGLEPVVAPSSKPWPVFTIADSTPAQTAKPPPNVDSATPLQRNRTLQARTVIQQCSEARVKIQPAHDGADAQWAEIQEGLVVYVCFFHGATEEVAHEMASSLMTTKFFRKDTGHSVSVLNLPGSVLFIPQDSLLGEVGPKRSRQYRGGGELWLGGQLFSTLISACREIMSGSLKCRMAGVKVEQGAYGQKQEISLKSAEPLTLLLEF